MTAAEEHGALPPELTSFVTHTRDLPLCCAPAHIAIYQGYADHRDPVVARLRD